MRTKQNTQPEFVFQLPSSAKVTREYFAAYDGISLLLDEHPEIVTRVHRDLRKPLTKARRRGPQGEACRYSSDTVLRMCLVKVLENLSYRRAVVRVDDSPRLRAFTRIHNGPMLDFSTFCVLANAISPEAWKALNTRLAKAAASEGLITGEKAPDVFAADKGFWESPFTTERLGWQVPLVAIGKKGKRTAEETAHERSLPFRLAQNFRAGVEGSISFLKVMLGLWRCMNKGFEHFVSTVGATVFAHNLLNLARDAG